MPFILEFLGLVIGLNSFSGVNLRLVLDFTLIFGSSVSNLEVLATAKFLLEVLKIEGLSFGRLPRLDLRAVGLLKVILVFWIGLRGMRKLMRLVELLEEALEEPLIARSLFCEVVIM